MNKVLHSATVPGTGADHTYVDQDVKAAATPQFARLGIGVAADANKLLNIVGATTKCPIMTTAGAGGAWQVGQNVGASGGDDTFGFYSATYGPTHSYKAILELGSGGEVFLRTIKSGATQAAAGAAAGEIWKTASHASLPDNVLLVGV